MTTSEELDEKLRKEVSELREMGIVRSKDDPLVDFMRVLAFNDLRLRDYIKQSNMVAIADALMTQTRFLNRYEAIMKRELQICVDVEAERFSESLKRILSQEQLRYHGETKQFAEKIYGIYDDQAKELKRLFRASFLFFCLALIMLGLSAAILYIGS